MITEVKCLTFPEYKEGDFFPKTHLTGSASINAPPKTVLRAILPNHFLGSYLGVHPQYLEVHPNRGYLHITSIQESNKGISLEQFFELNGFTSSKRPYEFSSKQKRHMVSCLFDELRKDSRLGHCPNLEAPYASQAYADLLSVLTGKNIDDSLIETRFSQQHKFNEEGDIEDYKLMAFNESGRIAFVFPN